MKKLFVIALLFASAFSLGYYSSSSPAVFDLQGLWFEAKTFGTDQATFDVTSVQTPIAGAAPYEQFRIRVHGVRTGTNPTVLPAIRLKLTVPAGCSPQTPQQVLTIPEMQSAYLKMGFDIFYSCSYPGVKQFKVVAEKIDGTKLDEISNVITISSESTCKRYSGNEFQFSVASSKTNVGKWVPKTPQGYYIELKSASVGLDGKLLGEFRVLGWDRETVLATQKLYACQEFVDYELGVQFMPLEIFPDGHAALSIAKSSTAACVDTDGDKPWREQLGIAGVCRDLTTHADYLFTTGKIVEYYCKDRLVCKGEVVDCVQNGFATAEGGSCVGGSGPCSKASNEFDFKYKMTALTDPVVKNGVSIRLLGFSYTSATFQATYGNVVTQPFAVTKGTSYNVNGIAVRVCDVVGFPSANTYASVGFAVAGATVTPTPTPIPTTTPTAKTLRVFVVDDDGAVKAVSVVLSLSSGRVVATKQTDVEGVVNFYPLDAGEYLLKVSKGGYLDYSSPQTVGADAITEVRVVLQKTSDVAPEKHWLRAFVEKGKLEIKNGNGVLTINGKGTITVKGAIPVVAGYGTGTVNQDGSRTYTGDGMLVVRGSKVDIKASGENFNFYAQGTGQLKLEGKGLYSTGAVGTMPSKWNGVPITNFGITLNGKGWLKAYGSGSISAEGASGGFVITGNGEITITDNGGSSSKRVISGFGSVETINANTKKYKGYGTLFLIGSSFSFSATGTAIDFYGKGSATKLTMNGDGRFKIGSDVLPSPSPSPSPSPQATKCVDTDSPYYNTIAPFEAGTCTDKTGVVCEDSSSGNILTECYCTPPFGADFSVKKCSKTIVDCTAYGSGYYAKDGACVKTGTPSCTDSDSSYPTLAERLGVLGTCADASGSHSDQTVSSTSSTVASSQVAALPLAVKEYYCSNNACQATVYNCPSYGYDYSSGGKCVKLGTGTAATGTTATVSPKPTVVATVIAVTPSSAVAVRAGSNCGGFTRLNCLDYSIIAATSITVPQIYVVWKNVAGQSINELEATIGGRTAFCSPKENVANNAQFGCLAVNAQVAKGNSLPVTVKYAIGGNTYTEIGYIVGK
ncbi:MAG: hypothetical protein V1811_00060 [Candidatus Micrarchaeota archaeon]